MSWKPTAAERRWKTVDGSPHLERHATTYGVETRCKECKRKELGYEVSHFPGCQHKKET